MVNKSVKVFITCLAIGVLLAVVFSSYQQFREYEQKEKVLNAVDRLHTQFNEQKFDEIYAESTPQFQESISRNKFIEGLSKWRQKFGEIEKDEQKDINPYPFSIDSNTQTARLTVFNGKKGIGNLTEEFVWDISNKEAKLINYKIFEVFTTLR